MKSKESSLSSEIISWFSSIEPKITVFESETKKISLTGQLRKSFLFKHTKSHGNLIDNRNIQKIESCIDGISNEFLWFLHKSFHFAIWFSHNYSESTWILNFCQYNGAFFAVLFVKCEHLFKREITDDITIEDKENSWFILVFDDVLCQFERSSCSHRLGLLRVG